MSRLGTPGDMRTVHAAADRFKCAVHIVTDAASAWYIRHVPTETTTATPPRRHLLLCWHTSPRYPDAFFPVILSAA